MNVRETICAVVVTFNRRQLLIECLDALKNQTYPLDAIYIVDNASNDKTPELLLESAYIKELPPPNLSEPWEKDFEIKNNINGNPIKVHYVRMHENTGSSGGFHEGIKRGYERGYDWFWLMDDDVEAFTYGLANLLKYINISKFIQSSRQLPNGNIFYWGDIVTSDGKYISVGDKISEKDYIEINTGCFEGMFIHRDIITKIGYPKKELFMVGDDTFYGWMASKYMRIICIKECCLKKKIEPKKIKAPLTEYLFFRNNYFLLKCFTNDSTIAKIRFFLKVIKKVLSRIIVYKSGALAFAVLKGYIDGVMGDFSNKYIKKILTQNNIKKI
ncbi:MAG: glycosyltransferase [Elusimicrobiales bacterium]|nr:glycosyltransferase [Elusimicrobiales bacterium]